MTEVAAAPEAHFDLVVTGGRVVDPRSGLDRVTSVAIRDGGIAVVGDGPFSADRVIDATGLVVSPGFVDLHSHAQSRIGLGLQALDGVTTALDLESGALPVAAQYAEAESEGRPINFGFSVSWAVARLRALVELPPPSADAATGRLPSALEFFQRNAHLARWNEPSNPAQVRQTVVAIEDGLADGGIGIGVLLGYAPGSGRDEYFAIARLAAAAGVPVFTHARQVSNLEPGSSLDGALEIIAAAAGSGAHMHICHINSTSLRRIDEIAAAIAEAQSRGNRITTEAYPYSTSSTGIGAVFLEPENLPRLGIGPRSITYLPTGRRVESEDELRHLRATDPSGLCLIDLLDGEDPADVRMLLRSFELPGTVVASDAMPVTGDGGRTVQDEWPLPPDARAHPRSVGTFSRTFGWLVRELGALSLPEAVLRSSTLPAELLAESVPAMRRKGRIAAGYDADLTIFDPALISDRATASALIPPTGVRHVVVGGRPVVRDGELDPTSSAGRAIRTG